MTSPRRRYEPPFARDLSGISAAGQSELEGLCYPGSSPITASCEPGSNPSQNPASCSPTGLVPNLGRCTTGGNAAEGCVTGSALT